MKIKAVIILVISCSLIIMSSTAAFASQSDIAIIGGADGPTEIFVASPNPSFLLIALAIAIIALIVISIIYIKRRKK